MSLTHHIQVFVHDLINDPVNLKNAMGGAVILCIKPLTYMHEISLLAREITPIIGAFTAFSLFTYNAVKIIKEIRKKD